MKKVLVGIAVFACLFFAAQESLAITIKLSERKVTVNDDRDDSSVVQKAFSDLLAAGGGTIEFPSGVVDIKNNISVIPTSYKPVNVIIKGDGSSIIRVSAGKGATIFTFGNLSQVKFEDMVIMGKNVPHDDPAFIDAGYVIFAAYVNLVKIVDTSFIGIAVPTGGAIIHVSSNLTIDNCQFEGNNPGYPEGSAINLDCCTTSGINANIKSTTFVDYSNFNGIHFSKTGIGAGNWIRVKQVYWTGAGVLNQQVTIEDSFFDEGAAVAISVENIAALNLKSSRFNVNPTVTGTGVKASNVRRVRLEDTLFGYASQARPFAILADSSVEMIGITRSHGVLCPQANPGTKITWRLSDCE